MNAAHAIPTQAVCSHPVYALLCLAARGKLENYTNDLHVHDVATLNRLDSTEPFIWVVRQSGTHLYPTRESLEYAKLVRIPGNRASALALSIARCFSDACSYYFWDGAKLRELKSAAALSELALQAERKVSK